MLQHAHLVHHRRATVDDHRSQAGLVRKLAGFLVDLAGQLARRRQHQGGRERLWVNGRSGCDHDSVSLLSSGRQ